MLLGLGVLPEWSATGEEGEEKMKGGIPEKDLKGCRRGTRAGTRGPTDLNGGLYVSQRY